MLHFVKFVQSLLMPLQFFSLVLPLLLVLLLKLPFRLWILVAHGFRGWARFHTEPIP